MKIFNKTILALMLMAVSAIGFAQDAEDAFNISEFQYIGSARTLGMGNAFTAVGGDLGAISINPASSAVLRMSEFSISPAFINANGSANYLDERSRSRFSKFGLTNFAYNQNLEMGRSFGLVNINFGMAFNRVKSFNSITTASGRVKAGENGSSWLADKACQLENYNTNDRGNYNSDIPWATQLAWNAYLIDELDDGTLLGSTENIDDYGNIFLADDIYQNFTRQTKGGIDEIALNFSGNWNDNLYFGVNANFYSVDYVVNEWMSESSFKSSIFDSGFENFEHSYWQSTSGSGVNIKAGIIFLPTKHLRIGATIQTPTWYTLTDNWQESISSEFDNGNEDWAETPLGQYDYRVTSPFRYSVGAAYTFGSKGLISVDYEEADYSSMYMTDYYGSNAPFSAENRYINNNYRKLYSFRAGTEWNLSSGVTVRAGYSCYERIRNPYQEYVSFGFGFNLSRSALFDVAWQGQVDNVEDFTLYDQYADTIRVPEGSATNKNNKLVCTLRLKF
ncbi:MAG: hypothetical protein GX664_01475 [Bacteroidales bacterium]|nr:hypothetical protein [Bacteroidales bacterium]